MNAAQRRSGSAPSRRVDSPLKSQLARALDAVAQGEGFSASPLPGVRYMRSTIHVPRTPVAYEPGIVIIAQGEKLGHFGDATFVYDPDRYLVLTVPLPFECETVGTPDRPVLGLSISLTPALVGEMLLQMDHPAPSPPPPRAIQTAALDDGLRGAALRLVEALRLPEDTRILGPQLVREITYRVLRGELGGNVRALAAPHSHFGRISRVLHRLHTDFARPIEIETLASEAGMSVSTFHEHFRAVTASSPLQYLKTLRLHKARMLMVNAGTSAAEAAARVGYESASQFSREFKRLFGAAPAAAAARLRASLIGLA